MPWWAIGTSLIAANIAADQIIGMNGDAYAMGIAIATYEWTAAVALIVVGKFLLPVYLKQQVFTMPQLLSQRYDRSVQHTFGSANAHNVCDGNLANYFVVGCKSCKQSYGFRAYPSNDIVGWSVTSILSIWRDESCRVNRCDSGCSSHLWWFVCYI